MNKFKFLGCLSAVAMLMASCGDDLAPIAAGAGRIELSVDVNSSILASEKARSRAEYTDISAADLAIALSSADGSYSNTWSSVADFPVDQNFKVGKYVIEASYGSIDEEGFEKPYFYGSQEIEVRENQVTPVAVTAELGNTLFTVTYTDAFKSYLKDYKATLHAEGGNYVEYPAAEVRPVYMRPGKVSVSVELTKSNGQSANLQVATVEAAAKHHYNVTVDLNNGEVGDAVLVVTFDDELVAEPVEIELSDELMNAPAPELTLAGFISDEPITNIAGEAYTSGPLSVSILARGGISAINLTTKAPSLVAQGWPAEANLAVASAAVKSTLTSLGINARGVWTNPDKMAVIDFAGVIKNLKSSDSPAQFILSVVDRYGKESEPVVLKVVISDLTIAISDPSDLVFGGTELDMTMQYNGSNPKDNVVLQYYNERGTWTDCPIKTATKQSEGVYRVSIDVPAATSVLKLRAITADKKTAISNVLEITPVVPAYTISAADTDVWATKAAVAVTDGTNSFVNFATVFVSTDGTNYTKAASTVDGDKLIVTGLQPATAYSVKASLTGKADDCCDPVTITTEAATQLPNASMETWYRQNGQTNYWWIDYPGEDADAVWGTMNLLTTSEGGNQTSWTNRNGCSYSAYSGTQPADGGVSGKCAYIATVGWGKGNSAAVISGMGTCQNLTVGELYLGKYNSDTKQGDYGYAFASRPASMTFYYKYTARNSADYGTAMIEVLDEAGNVLATKSTNLAAASAFTATTLKLDYTAGAAKAAKIKVVFTSSGNADCQTINATNLSAPPARNTSNGRYTGSELYIDEITLNY